MDGLVVDLGRCGGKEENSHLGRSASLVGKTPPHGKISFLFCHVFLFHLDKDACTTIPLTGDRLLPPMGLLDPSPSSSLIHH